MAVTFKKPGLSYSDMQYVNTHLVTLMTLDGVGFDLPAKGLTYEQPTNDVHLMTGETIKKPMGPPKITIDICLHVHELVTKMSHNAYGSPGTQPVITSTPAVASTGLHSSSSSLVYELAANSKEIAQLNEEVNTLRGMAGDMELAKELIADLLNTLQVNLDLEVLDDDEVAAMEMAQKFCKGYASVTKEWTRPAWLVMGEKITLCLKKPSPSQLSGKKTLELRAVLNPSMPSWSSLLTKVS